MIARSITRSLSSLLFIAVFVGVTPHAWAQSSLQSFRLQQVTLLPGVFKNAQQTDMAYMLALDPDRVLAP
jgi:hypothetical protein